MKRYKESPSNMDTVKDAKRINKINLAINNLNVVMADATFIQGSPEFNLLSKRCRGSLGLQIADAQKLLNDYQIVQKHGETYVEIPFNYKQFLAHVIKCNRVLNMHIQKINLCLKRFLATA